MKASIVNRTPEGRSAAAADGQPEEVFLEHLDLIESSARLAGKRSGFSDEQLEDFISIVRLKLIDDDYRILKNHRGDSLLSTFLVAVINNLSRDYRDHLWGKFRPSAKAQALGDSALVLERLIVRDGFDVEAAVRIARQRFGLRESREEIELILGELPNRPRRRFMTDQMLENERAGSESSPESRVERAHRSETARRVKELMDQALLALDPQDLIILRMHLRDGWTLAKIARHLRLDQQALYPRRRRCIRILRQHFAAQGLNWEEVRDLLGWRDLELSSILTDPQPPRTPREPSREELP